MTLIMTISPFKRLPVQLSVNSKFKPFKKRRNYSESGHQQAFFTLLRLKYPAIRPFAFSIPNGGKRNVKEAKRMVAEGLTKGVLDVMLAYPCGKYSGMFIEFKSGTGSMAPEQRQMFYRFSSVGYKCCVCRTAIDALEKVEEYLESEGTNTCLIA